jgi:S1-C subfamily serine protease
MNGEVIAVNTAILPEYGGSNIGIPAPKVINFLNQVESQKIKSSEK